MAKSKSSQRASAYLAATRGAAPAPAASAPAPAASAAPEREIAAARDAIATAVAAARGDAPAPTHAVRDGALVCQAATWARLPSGEWGICVVGPALPPAMGDRVRVSRLDGSTSLETIERVYQSGGRLCAPVERVFLCTIENARPVSPPRGRGRGRRGGWRPAATPAQAPAQAPAPAPVATVASTPAPTVIAAYASGDTTCGAMVERPEAHERPRFAGPISCDYGDGADLVASILGGADA